MSLNYGDRLLKYGCLSGILRKIKAHPLAIIVIIIIIIIIIANGFLPCGSGTTVRHNTQITHITQNNTPHSNKT
jgi:hypothetical protein